MSEYFGGPLQTGRKLKKKKEDKLKKIAEGNVIKEKKKSKNLKEFFGGA